MQKNKKSLSTKNLTRIWKFLQMVQKYPRTTGWTHIAEWQDELPCGWAATGDYGNRKEWLFLRTHPILFPSSDESASFCQGWGFPCPGNTEFSARPSCKQMPLNSASTNKNFAWFSWVLDITVAAMQWIPLTHWNQSPDTRLFTPRTRTREAQLFKLWSLDLKDNLSTECASIKRRHEQFRFLCSLFLWIRSGAVRSSFFIILEEKATSPKISRNICKWYIYNFSLWGVRKKTSCSVWVHNAVLFTMWRHTQSQKNLSQGRITACIKGRNKDNHNTPCLEQILPVCASLHSQDEVTSIKKFFQTVERSWKLGNCQESYDVGTAKKHNFKSSLAFSGKMAWNQH